jgi:hypothetical protein
MIISSVLQGLVDNQQVIHDNIPSGEGMLHTIRATEIGFSYPRHALNMQFISSAARISAAHHHFKRVAAASENLRLPTEARDAIEIHRDTSELLHQNSIEMIMESFSIAKYASGL